MTAHSITNLPENILDDIVSYLSNKDRFIIAGTCRFFHHYISQPRFWQNVHIDSLEFGSLVLFLTQLTRVATRLEALTIQNCFSDFLDNATVPVASAIHLQNMPLLYQRITSLPVERRRAEYKRHQFNLHHEFSEAIMHLFSTNTRSLRTFRIQGCSLDLDMTSLLLAIVQFGRGLEELVYDRNHDHGIEGVDLFDAVISACPNMRRFRGAHAGLDDIVLSKISRGWPHLTSLTIVNSLMMSSRQDYRMQAGNSGVGSTIGGGPVSAESLYRLLESCLELEELELHDLDCIINGNLAFWAETARRRHKVPHDVPLIISDDTPRSFYHPYCRLRNSNLAAASQYRHHPLKTRSVSQPSPQSHSTLPGTSLKRLLITKFITTPLSLPGFESILELFPNLRQLEYFTNFTTFDRLFEDITPELIDSERAAVESHIRSYAPHCHYQGCWDIIVTPEQKLLAPAWIL